MNEHNYKASKKKRLMVTCHSSNAFDLTEKGWEAFAARKGIDIEKGDSQYYHVNKITKYKIYDSRIRRTDKDLIKVIRELGTDASNWVWYFEIMIIPPGYDCELVFASWSTCDRAGYSSTSSYEKVFLLKDGWRKEVTDVQEKINERRRNYIKVGI